jgi:hypothetical protein
MHAGMPRARDDATLFLMPEVFYLTTGSVPVPGRVPPRLSDFIPSSSQPLTLSTYTALAAEKAVENRFSSKWEQLFCNPRLKFLPKHIHSSSTQNITAHRPTRLQNRINQHDTLKVRFDSVCILHHPADDAAITYVHGAGNTGGTPHRAVEKRAMI